MLNLLFKRRSIRKYQGKPIEGEKIQELIKALLLSPSSRNIKPWEFIVIDDRELLKQLASSKSSSAAFLSGAALGIVIIADSQKSDVWVEDCSIASIILQLMAESLGLGSCWIQIRERWHESGQRAGDYIKKLLNIPEPYQVESIIAIGYPAENKSPHSESELPYYKVHFNDFGKAYKISGQGR
jgi:nitroreductase